MGVGFPATLLLHEFGSQVWAAFGDMPYHVGSSLTQKTGWRDVDVRMILDDEEYERMGLGDPRNCQHNAKWVALCRAFSALGKEMTGLPIDFQLQQQTRANEEYPTVVEKDGVKERAHQRSALGFIPLRIKDIEDNAAYFRTMHKDISEVINNYHAALDRHEHGGVAQDRAFKRIEQIIAEGNSPK